MYAQNTVTVLILSELYFWRNDYHDSSLNRSVLLAARAACVVDGGAHVGAPEHLDTARLHRPACGASLGALRMGVVTYVDPRERPAFVATLGEVVGCTHAWHGMMLGTTYKIYKTSMELQKGNQTFLRKQIE